MSELVRCDGCGETADEPLEDGWGRVEVGVAVAGEEVPEMPEPMRQMVGGGIDDATHDSLDFCPDCTGGIRAAQVTGAFLEFLEAR